MLGFLEKLKLLAPAILSLIPSARPYANLIIAAIAVAEESGKKGADKKTIAMETVKASAEAANIIAKSKGATNDVVDVNLVTSTAEAAIDTVIGVINITKPVIDKKKK